MTTCDLLLAPWTRCRLAEKILSLLELPCAYSPEGCDYHGHLKTRTKEGVETEGDLARHERRCRFRLAQCPNPFCKMAMRAEE